MLEEQEWKKYEKLKMQCEIQIAELEMSVFAFIFKCFSKFCLQAVEKRRENYWQSQYRKFTIFPFPTGKYDYVA